MLFSELEWLFYFIGFSFDIYRESRRSSPCFAALLSQCRLIPLLRLLVLLLLLFL
jgi:hypothetical protein